MLVRRASGEFEAELHDSKDCSHMTETEDEKPPLCGDRQPANKRGWLNRSAVGVASDC